MTIRLTIALAIAGVWTLGCAVDSVFVVGEEPAEAADDRAAVAVEVDVLDGVASPIGELEIALDIASRSLADVGINVDFVVEHEAAESAPERLVDREAKAALLARTRDRDDAIHLVIAARGAGAHGLAHYSNASSPSASSPRDAGLFVFADQIGDDFAANEILAWAGLRREQLLGRTIAHELGHALGCPHRVSAVDASVMVQNSVLGPINEATLRRWREALDGGGLGHPRFDDDARECLDASARLSVELSRPAYAE